MAVPSPTLNEETQGRQAVQAVGKSIQVKRNGLFERSKFRKFSLIASSLKCDQTANFPDPEVELPRGENMSVFIILYFSFENKRQFENEVA